MKKDFFTADYTQGQLNAFVKKLAEQSGYEDVVEKVLCNEITFSVASKPWSEKDGYIDFGELVAPGWTAKEWEAELIKGGHKLSDWTKDVLSKPDFDENHRYPAGTKLHVVVIRGKQIQKDSERTTSNLKALGSQKFGEKAVSELKAELSLMLRLKYSNKDLEKMDLVYIGTLSKPIIDSDGDSDVLVLSRHDDKSWVLTDWDNPSDYWFDNGGFAFLQVSV